MYHQLEELASYCDPRLCLFSGMYIFWIAALAFHSQSTLLNALFMVPIALLCMRLVYGFEPEYPPSSSYVFSAFAMVLLFKASDSVLLRNYQPPLRKIGQKKSLSEMTVRERLSWATHFAIATRGIGWTHEPSNYLPPRPRRAKNSFILSQIAWISFWLVQWDILSIAIRSNPYFLRGGPSLSELGWMWRGTVWAWVLAAYYGGSIGYTVASIVGVAADLSKPNDWPPFFGSPKDAYTVRNAWGRVWHQMLRKFKLCGSFCISGLIHYAADFTLTGDWSGNSLWFFPLQVVAITCEGFVIFLARKSGFQNRAVWVYVGYVWVILWFTWSLAIWMDPMFRAGLMEGSTPTISLLLGISRGEWIPKWGVDA